MEPIPTDRNRHLSTRSRATPLWIHALFCLPTCRSVPRGQKSVPRCRTPCPGGRAERPGLRAPHTPPALPAAPWGAPAGEASRLPSQQPKRLRDAARVRHILLLPHRTCVKLLLDVFTHPPRCSHDPRSQVCSHTSKKCRKCSEPLTWPQDFKSTPSSAGHTLAP